MEINLKTARLWLREIQPELGQSEAALLLEYHQQNLQFEKPWTPTPPQDFLTLGYWMKHLNNYSKEKESAQCVRFLGFTQDHQKLVLRANITQIFRGPFQAAYLGYSVHHSVQGQGIMTEGLQAILNYAFQTMNLHRIMANYIPENHASARVIEKLGFEKEGFAKNYLQIAGQWRDHVLTAKTNSAWVENTPRSESSSES